MITMMPPGQWVFLVEKNVKERESTAAAAVIFGSDYGVKRAAATTPLLGTMSYPKVTVYARTPPPNCFDLFDDDVPRSRAPAHMALPKCAAATNCSPALPAFIFHCSRFSLFRPPPLSTSLSFLRPKT